MKKTKNIVAALVSAAMAMSLAACGGSAAAPATQEASSTAAETSDGKTYTVGISQYVQHPALDAATQGFKDALTKELGDAVKFDEQNANGDAATTTTIAQGLVAGKVDLIMANATPALQAAAAATQDIPILGTSVTEYGVAMGIQDFDGTVGGNISGTSDLAPLDQQEDIILDFVPDAKTLGILYCSAEDNSKYQADEVKKFAEEDGLEVKIYTFSDSNDVTSVTQQACSENDVLYVPTDNVAASCAEAINNVALPAGVPIVCGEEGLMNGCGIATLSIDYYGLGEKTGEMAAKVLKGEEDISQMAISYYDNPVKEYNPVICSELGLTVPEGYDAVEVEAAE